MSLRINSDFNGVTDPDAGRYIAAVEAADGQLLEFGVGKAINDFVVGCKQDRIWDAIKASCILAGARTTNGALVPLVGTAPTPVNFDLVTNTDYNRKTGLVGNGSTKYLDTNRAENADPQNSVHTSVYITSAFANGQYILFGSDNSSSTGLFRGGGAAQTYSRNLTVLTSNSNTVGFAAASRFAATSTNSRIFGTATTSSLVSNTSNTSNYQVFKSPTFSSSLGNGRLAFYSIGESLDLALLDARVTALITAFGVAIP